MVVEQLNIMRLKNVEIGMTNKRLVIVQVAGLGYEFLRRQGHDTWRDLKFQPLDCVFPALTCTAQASFRTALPPSGHGMIANGLYHRDLRRPLLWEQSSGLVSGPRLWEAYRKRGKRVAMLFWQQSLGEAVDMILSPAPVHKHGGGMMPSVYSQPDGLYASLCDTLGNPFRLHRYWGPLASAASSDWIARATAAVLAGGDQAPDLCLTYLPALDYDLQRHGPGHASAERALAELLYQLTLIRTAAETHGYDMIVFGDYAIGPVSEAILPNRALHEAGLFRTRTVNGMLYPDFHTSQAFAMVDHEIAHVYVTASGQAGVTATIRECLSRLTGIGQILGPAEKSRAGIDHPHSGDLVLEAKPGAWFAYPWWSTRKEAPDFAAHVDIHNKPGYDPCELFFGWPPVGVSQDPSRIRGSHGRTTTDARAAWAATCPLPGAPTSLIQLAECVRQRLEAAP